MNQVTPNIDRDKRDDNIHLLNSNPVHITNLLAVLGVKDDDTEHFLDAWNSGLYGGNLSPLEYSVFKKYLGDRDFIERYTYFARHSQDTLRQEGFSDEEINWIGVDLQEHIEILLTKFAIFDLVENPENIGNNFRCICHTPKLGQVIVSHDGDVTYLLRGKVLYNVQGCITNPEGKLKYLIFPTESEVVVHDFLQNEMFAVPGLYADEGQEGDNSWLKTVEEKSERLTILETKVSTSVTKFTDPESGALYTRFHRVHHTDSLERSLVSYCGIEFRVSEQRKESGNNSGGALRTFDSDRETEIIIRKKEYDALIRVPDGRELFYCNGIIKKVYVTDFDTYIVYEETFYDEDKVSPASSTYTFIYSLEKESAVLKVAENERFHVISDRDNFIVFHYKGDEVSYQEGEISFYNFRDEFSCLGIGNIEITQDERDPSDVFISFQNLENGMWFHYSTKYTEIETIHDEETGRLTGASIGRKNIH